MSNDKEIKQKISDIAVQVWTDSEKEVRVDILESDLVKWIQLLSENNERLEGANEHLKQELEKAQKIPFGWKP